MNKQADFRRKRYRPRIPFFLLSLLFAFCATLEAQESSPILVMVSVDGMRPDYITHADEHGAKVPNLRRFITEGSHAGGVQGGAPTVTYRRHTTLVSEVCRAKTWIYAKPLFDLR